jgi:putative endonuclease
LAAGDAEADLIAHEGGDVVIVEVKTRQTAAYGPPDRAIDSGKLRHLMRVAREYARKTDIALDRIRIDVVAVVLTKPPEIVLYRSVLRLNR